MFTNPAITITVTGGSFEDNTQICNLVHNALRNQGMTNVSAEASIAGYIDESPEMTQALRHLNPDLFDTPVVIAGECEGDIQSQVSMLGYEPAMFDPGSTVLMGGMGFHYSM